MIGPISKRSWFSGDGTPKRSQINVEPVPSLASAAMEQLRGPLLIVLQAARRTCRARRSAEKKTNKKNNVPKPARSISHTDEGEEEES